MPIILLFIILASFLSLSPLFGEEQHIIAPMAGVIKNTIDVKYQKGENEEGKISLEDTGTFLGGYARFKISLPISIIPYYSRVNQSNIFGGVLFINYLLKIYKHIPILFTIGQNSVYIDSNIENLKVHDETETLIVDTYIDKAFIDTFVFTPFLKIGTGYPFFGKLLIILQYEILGYYKYTKVNILPFYFISQDKETGDKNTTYISQIELEKEESFKDFDSYISLNIILFRVPRINLGIIASYNIDKKRYKILSNFIYYPPWWEKIGILLFFGYIEMSLGKNTIFAVGPVIKF